jgi:phytoene dehydrogenase-like protein
MITDHAHERPSPTSLASGQVAVVGGGIAGLVAAARIAQRGVPVTLVEKTSHVGGRAVTRNRDGFLFNLGPHALYGHGRLQATLRQLGVVTQGGLAPAGGGFALYDGRLHALPVGFASLLRTRVLTLAGKFELARLLAGLPRVNAAAVRDRTLAWWLDAHLADRRVRAVVEMLVRVTGFTHDPARQSAGAAIEQLQLALRGDVRYLDGGWQTMVDGLRAVVVRAGVRVLVGASATAVDRNGDTAVAVHLADSTLIPAAAVVLAVPPAEVDRLTGVSRFADVVSPVRLATLDVGLRSLPRPKTLLAFGVDEPVYFSVHSVTARLAPAGGAVIHASMYLAPGQESGRDVEQRLESLLDQLQPGWRAVVVTKHFVPNLVVTHAALLAGTARPLPRVGGCSNVFVAGDWVGAHGQLSDAAAASGEGAAELAVAAATGRADRAAVA